jgi:hypothetical protein
MHLSKDKSAIKDAKMRDTPRGERNDMEWREERLGATAEDDLPICKYRYAGMDWMAAGRAAGIMPELETSR